MKTIVEFSRVHKIYRTTDVQVHAVRDVSFQIAAGEFVAIMGASGSGKSTLMNIVGCLDRPTSGIYHLDGINTSAMDRNALAEIRNRKLGFVFQGFNLLPRTSALENVELPMLYSRPSLSARSQRERAQQMLALVGLADRADHVPSQLSGGQQQRVAVARALVLDPALLLADEPTGNLDTRTSMEMMGIFQRLNEQGITIIMVTHELDIATYAKRNIVMRDGQIVHDTPVATRRHAEQELRGLEHEHRAASLTS